MYRSLEECIIDLEKAGELVRVHEEVDPNLEMAAIQNGIMIKTIFICYLDQIQILKYQNS